ncbi:MAG: hypothetical protein E6K29_18295 [Gammaproteobacteria bacterium]|nr:MAG: hypothetical protein E6K29_18295 [Gammaproteobacteria bacterium]
MEGAVVTTVGPSEREEPAPAEAAKPPQPVVPIGEAQESVLAHWILKAAQSLQEANQTHARLSLEHKGRRYSAFLERRPAADEMGIDRLRVEISTEQNGKRLLTLLELKRLAFSHFTQLVDDWDQEDLLHGDVIVGRFHSNSVVRLRLDRIAPQVLGKLTTAASQVDLENGGPRALRRIFRGGIETNTPRISLPADFRSFVEDHADRNKMRTFERSARVTFYSDGSYGSRELGSTTAEERHTMSAPHYIVAGRGATLAVHGTVRGAVVVYSPERIVIEGNLVYAHDPRSDAGAEDYLGLISSKDVEIAPPSRFRPRSTRNAGSLCPTILFRAGRRPVPAEGRCRFTEVSPPARSRRPNRATRRATTSMSASSGCAPRVSRSPTDTKSTRGIRSGARLKTIGLRKLRKGYGCRVSDPAPLTDRRAGCTGICRESGLRRP